ncbi:T-box transcription factor TBX2 [Biomphalaria glabrata]|nr:T-box transcription factor TBX2-like [Biomphalaria glabrata]
MAYHPFLYQRPSEFQGQPTHPAQFLSPRAIPFTLPLGGPFTLGSGPPHPAGVTSYCPGSGGLGPLPGFLLAEYLAHPEYYRTLRAAAGFEPKDDGVKDNPKADLEGLNLWDMFYQHGTEMVITKSGR